MHGRTDTRRVRGNSGTPTGGAMSARQLPATAAATTELYGPGSFSSREAIMRPADARLGDVERDLGLGIAPAPVVKRPVSAGGAVRAAAAVNPTPRRESRDNVVANSATAGMRDAATAARSRPSTANGSPWEASAATATDIAEMAARGGTRAASASASASAGVGGGGGKSAGTTTRRKAAKSGEGRIVIHVYDEARNIQRDFSCNLQQLLASMRYFQVRACACACVRAPVHVTHHAHQLAAQRGSLRMRARRLWRVWVQDYLSGVTREEVEMAVHCDVVVFEWLLAYVEGKPAASLDASNCVPILISSQFLKVRHSLVGSHLCVS